MFTLKHMRNRSNVFPSLVIILVSILGCSDTIDSRFQSLSNQVSEDVIMKDPFLTTSKPNVLINFSSDATNNWFDDAYAYQRKLDKLKSEGLTQTEAKQFEILKDYLNRILIRDSFRFHNYPISHLFGPHLDYPKHFNLKAADSKIEIEEYLDELQKIEGLFGALIEGLEHRRKNGNVLPTFILNQVLNQCDSLSSLPVTANSFYLDFERKLNAIGLLEPNLKSEFLSECNGTVSKSIIPAYKRLTAYLRQLELRSVSVAGVWQLPNGDDYYRFTLFHYSGVENDPSDLYEIAKVQLATIEGEMQIFSALTTAPSLAKFPIPADTSSRFLYFPAFERGLTLYKQHAQLATSTEVTPEYQINFLQQDQLANAKLMVDIGIHHKQWLREQAIRFLLKHSSLSEPQATAEVDRIVVFPGLEGSAKIGHMKLIELQGNKTEKDFLEELEKLGPMPLKMLQKRLPETEELAS